MRYDSITSSSLSKFNACSCAAHRTTHQYHCCAVPVLAGYQALLFAPTELLAGQHNKTLERLAEDLPMKGMRPRVGMLVGSITPAAKKQLKKEIAVGDKNIIISTQAALWVKDWHKLALVVVDEQHKYVTTYCWHSCASGAHGSIDLRPGTGASPDNDKPSMAYVTSSTHTQQ
jgi:ERCC4-related helicase